MLLQKHSMSLGKATAAAVSRTVATLYPDDTPFQPHRGVMGGTGFEEHFSSIANAVSGVVA